MSFTIPDPIIKPFCNNGDETPPPINTSTTAANQETGFPPLQSQPLNSGGVPVDRTQFNGVIRFYTQQILAMEMGVKYTFNQDISDEWGGYPLGIVLYCESNNSYQISLVDNNTANFVTNPSYIDDGVNWISMQSIRNLSTVDLDIKNNSTSGSTWLRSAATSNHYLILPVSQPDTDGRMFVGNTDGTTEWSWARGNTNGTPSPGSGYLGESISQYGTNVLNHPSTQVDLATINLQPGIWDISGMACLFGAVTETGLNANATILPLGGSSVSGNNEASLSFESVTPGIAITLTIPQYRYETTTTIPVYLRINCVSFNATNTILQGRITATRVG